MSISIDAIVEKEFKIKGKGYDPEEVDKFLDEICDALAALEEEKMELKRKLDAASSIPAYNPVPAPAAVPPPAPVPVEAPAPVAEATSESAQKLLAKAQRIYDEMVEEAKAEAEDIITNARARAEMGLEKLEEEKAALQQEVNTLKEAAQDYRERFLRLVEDQSHVLKSELELF